MASESVDIIIEADDQASRKLAEVSNRVAAMADGVKTVGSRFKASTELAGTFANVLGGSAFGSAAGEIAGLTERISAFSEVAKSGGAGAMALKAGLVAASGIAGYKVGEAISGWIVQTEKWQAAMAAAVTNAQRLDQQMAQFAARRSAETMQDIQVAMPGEERNQVIEAAIARLEAEKQGFDDAVERAKQVVKESIQRRDAWSIDAVWNRGNRQAEVGLNEGQLNESRQRRDALQQELITLKDLVSERAKMLEQKAADNAARLTSTAAIEQLEREVALLKASGDERLRLQAAQMAPAPEMQGRVEELLKERDAMQAIADFERDLAAEEDRAAQQREASAQRVQDLVARELATLEQRRIAIVDGAEAAKEYALIQQGVGKTEAQAIVQQAKLLDEIEKQKQSDKTLEGIDRTPQQAIQSRLMTRGDGGNVEQQQLSTLKQLVTIQQQALQQAAALARASQEKRPFTVTKLVVP